MCYIFNFSNRDMTTLSIPSHSDNHMSIFCSEQYIPYLDMPSTIPCVYVMSCPASGVPPVPQGWSSLCCHDCILNALA